MKANFTFIKKIFFIFILAVFGMQNIIPVDYGAASGNVPIIVTPAPFISGSGNNLLEFGWFKDGFTFSDLKTSATFNSAYPVSGTIDLKGGTLYLQSDMILHNNANIVNNGIIYGNGHIVEFSDGISDSYITNTSIAVLNLSARETLFEEVRSVDWSYDDKYVAVVTDYSSDGSFSPDRRELKVYSFDKSVESFYLLDTYNLLADGYSVRWHPSAYYIAIGKSTFTELQVFAFNPTTSKISLLDSDTISSPTRAVEWHPGGNFLVAGSDEDSRELSLYSFDGSNISLIDSVDISNNPNVEDNSLSWDPSGSYLAVGLQDGGSSDPELLKIYYFDGSSLTETLSRDCGADVTAIDWSLSGSFIAVGLNSGANRLQIFEHRVWNGGLLFVDSHPESETVLSVDWDPTGKFLAIGRKNDGGEEFKTYNFDLSNIYMINGIDNPEDVNAVKFSHTGLYIARGDNNNFVSVYKQIDSSFLFDNVELYLNDDISPARPISFQGNCSINGRGNRFIFNEDSGINIKRDSMLDVHLTTLECDKASAFSFEAKSSRLKLQDCNVDLNADVIMGDGGVEVSGDVVLRGPKALYYENAYTATVNKFSKLKLEDGATLSVGRNPKVTRQPLEFIDETSVLDLDNSDLRITNSGMVFTKGTIKFSGPSSLKITNTERDFGLIIGNSNQNEDPVVKLITATLTVTGGSLAINTFDEDRIIFSGVTDDNNVVLDKTSLLFLDMPVHLVGGGIHPGGERIFSSGMNITTEQTRFKYKDYDEDFILTGTIIAPGDGVNPVNVVLDNNDELQLLHGDLTAKISVLKNDNVISGNGGSFLGELEFTDQNSTLTWRLQAKINENNINLNGGTITYEKDSGFMDNLIFENNGVVNLKNRTLSLGSVDTDWNTNIYWSGDYSTIELSSKLSLSKTWTISGNMIIEGNGQILDLGALGQIVVDSSSLLEFRNVIIENLSGTNLKCLNNSGNIIFQNVVINPSDDFRFENGSILFQKDVVLSGSKKFAYQSSLSSTIDKNSNLLIDQDCTFEMGQVVTPNNQPLLFIDYTSRLSLNNSTLKIDNPGVLITKGKIRIFGSSTFNITDSNSQYGLFLGDGISSNDPILEIMSATLHVDTGTLNANTFRREKILFSGTLEDNNICFDNTSTFSLIRPITLVGGTICMDGYSIFSPYQLKRLFTIETKFKHTDHDEEFCLSGHYYYPVEGPVPVLITPFNKLRLISGDLVASVFVLGSENSIISGNGGRFFGPVTLFDSSSELIWRLDSKANENDITLNGGKIIYEEDSGFIKDVVFADGGIVDLTDRTLELGLLNASWNGDIVWIGDRSLIDLQSTTSLSGLWTIKGNIVIDGNDQKLDLGQNGQVVIDSNSTLELRNILIDNLKSTNLRCSDDSARLILQNVVTHQSQDYYFNKGTILFQEDVVLTGTKKFAYQSRFTSTIDSKSVLTIDRNMIFSYEPQTSNNSLIFMTDLSSVLFLNSCTLYVTKTGMQLTRGTLLVDSKNYLYNENSPVEPATNISEAIKFGNNNAVDNLNIEIVPGGNITLVSGILDYQNS